jgi:hypothetical protein
MTPTATAVSIAIHVLPLWAVAIGAVVFLALSSMLWVLRTTDQIIGAMTDIRVSWRRFRQGPKDARLPRPAQPAYGTRRTRAPSSSNGASQSPT